MNGAFAWHARPVADTRSIAALGQFPMIECIHDAGAAPVFPGWTLNGPPGEPEHPQQDPPPQRPTDPIDPGRPQQPEVPPIDPHTPPVPEPRMRGSASRSFAPAA
jgi:hypothetical protein